MIELTEQQIQALESPEAIPPRFVNPRTKETFVLVRDARSIAEGSAEMLPLPALLPPLRVDQGGVVRVGHSRISLDLIVEQYENGMTPEDMVRAYDTLVLADVHDVLAYYLRHRDEVRAYRKRRQEEAETLRAKIESERPRVSWEELLARRHAKDKDDAPADDILVIAECMPEEEIRNQIVVFLPLRK